MTDFEQAFSDPEFVANYEQGPPRFVPGHADLLRMTGLLLAERCRDDAHVLGLGAGGGLEFRALARDYPGWTFQGIDPAPQMIALARQILGPLWQRVQFHEGLIHDGPTGPFDAAVCLLTLHFLEPEDRLQTLIALRQRLCAGAPVVFAHSSFPQDERREVWLNRYAAFAFAAGAPADMVQQARQGVEAQTTILEPAVDESLISEAGFSGAELFYAAFTWRGWVAYA